MQLNLQSGNFTEMWQWTLNTNEHPTTDMNAMAYNVVDGIAYGIFKPTTSTAYTTPSYLCRFSHVQNSAVCLCQAMYWGFTATITRDGTFYLARTGGARIAKLANVATIPFPSGSPLPYSSLSSCGMTEVLPGGRGTGGSIDVSSSGLTTADMDAAYNLTDSTGCTSCYLTNSVWTKSGSSAMSTWLPGGQNFADFIDFEYNSITYLIGLGTYDGSVFIIKLDGNGGGDITGHAYSRVVMDYTGATNSLRTLAGFGAG